MTALDVEAAIKALSKLGVHRIPDDWVEYVWEQQFLNVEPLPDDIQEDLEACGYYIDFLKNILKQLEPWTSKRTVDEEHCTGFWTTPIEDGVQVKNLVTFLYYLIHSAHKRTSTCIQRVAGIHAAAVYLALVTVPGSGAFQVFHSMLFQKVMELFKILGDMDGSSKKKRKRSSFPNSQSSQGGPSRSKAKKGSRNAQPADDSFGDDEDRMEEEEEEESQMSAQEMQKISTSLLTLLRVLIHLLKYHSLKNDEATMRVVLDALFLLVRQEPGNLQDTLTKEVDISKLHCFTQLGYIGLNLMCSEKHGPPAKMVHRFLQVKHLLYLLLMLGERGGVMAANIPVALHNIQQDALDFVSHLLKKYGDPVHPPIRILVQYLCTRVPDKAEYRSKVSKAVVTLVEKLPVLPYCKIMEWILKFSRGEKMSYRSFAVELLSEMLKLPEKQKDDSLPDRMSLLLQSEVLIQAIFDRCSDQAPTVRARALALVSQFLESSEQGISHAVQGIMSPGNFGSVLTPLQRSLQDAAASGKGQESTGTMETVEPSVEQQSKQDERPPGDASAGSIHPASAAEGNVLSVPEIHVVQDSTPGTNASSGTVGGGTDGSAGPSKVSLSLAADCCTPKTIMVAPGVNITLQDGAGVASMLRRRVEDPKVNVRKAAIQALESLIKTEKNAASKENLEHLSRRCWDTAVSARKQALQSMTEILHTLPTNPAVQRVWLQYVLPLVSDKETSVQDKCMSLVEEIILHNIVPYHRTKEHHHKMAWNLLSLMADEHEQPLRQNLQKACLQWSRIGRVTPAVFSTLASHVGTENNQAVWMLLKELAPLGKKYNTDFIVDYWNETAKHLTGADSTLTTERVLMVIASAAAHIPSEHRKTIKAGLKAKLQQFSCPLAIIDAGARTLYKLCAAEGEDEEATQRLVEEWGVDLLRDIEVYLAKVVQQQPEDPIEEKRLICYIYTMGLVGLYCAKKTSKRLLLLVQSLVAAPVVTEEGSNVSGHSDDGNKDTSGHSDGVAASQPVGPSQFEGPGTQPLTQFRGSNMPAHIRAHAFITLGKLCLVHKDLARKCVPALARELEISDSAAIKSNVIVVLCDLCVRYTTMVDSYMLKIAACLKDRIPAVRKQALLSMTKLLQEDYVKMKGPLFYRFISTIVDTNAEITKLAECILIEILLKRHPHVFFNHFVECIFYFNSFEAHKVYNQFTQTEKEKKLFSMDGKGNIEKRQYVYKFMLEQMTDEQKFNLTSRLVQDVLGGFADDTIVLNAESAPVLRDTLLILSTKEIKLSQLSKQAVEDVAESEQEKAAIVMKAAKKNVLAQVVKKIVTENIVPTVISVKHLLDRQKSPLLKHLMGYLRELMKDYKNEVKEILTGNKQLADEIEFDMRRYDEGQMDTSRAATPTGTPTPSRPTTPKRQGSPSSFRLASPSQVPGKVKTPSNIPPAVNVPLGSPLRNNKAIPLATMAIINSARKAMEERRARMGTPQKEQAGKAAATPLKQTANHLPVPPNQGGLRGRTDGTMGRLWSTPAGNIQNLTFRQGMAPGLSPIAGEMSGVGYSPSVGSSVEGGDSHNKVTIQLQSPMAQVPKPRMWNIKSPATSKTKKALDLGDTTEEEEDAKTQRNGSDSESEIAKAPPAQPNVKKAKRRSARRQTLEESTAQQNKQDATPGNSARSKQNKSDIQQPSSPTPTRRSSRRRTSTARY